MILALWSPQHNLFAQLMLGPLDYNPGKWNQSAQRIIQSSMSQVFSYNPAGDNVYFQLDTLSLPLKDDFSTNRFMRYEPWFYAPPFDTVRTTVRVEPSPAQWPFQFTSAPSYTYILSGGNQIDSFLNVPHKIILFNDSLNPFVEKDTLLVWSYFPLRLVYDTSTLSIDTIPQLADGLISSDTTDTIRIYLPNGDGSIWIENQTYINNTMGRNPPTVGVVTFDGTDQLGSPYNFSSTSYGRCDRLTSKPIHLQYPVSDSLYLSFWVQPQGNGYAPAAQDSLILEFKDPLQGKWYRMWGAAGDSVRPFSIVHIPITNPRFLKDGFQFRWVNYANQSGNQDHWNLDYVYLARFRSKADTIHEDVAFVSAQPHFLREYTAMPWTQVTMPDIEQKWVNKISNCGSQTRAISYGFEVSDEDGNVFNAYPTDYNPSSLDTNAIGPYSSSGYSTYSRWSNPDFTYDFAMGGYFPLQDSATFRVKHFLTQLNNDFLLTNDTVEVVQPFHNYFAYDDGTAEVAAWLGVPGYMAMKFQNNFADTLYGISIYFSPVKENNLSRNIDLHVWRNLDEAPLYTEKVRIGVSPLDQNARRIYQNNGFTTYILEQPVPLTSGPFYIGWLQNQIFKVNVGFDRNNDASQHCFYRIGQSWESLDIPGTPMMRPMVANDFNLDQLSTPSVQAKAPLLVYPNPARDRITLVSEEAWKQARLIDATGRELFVYASSGEQHQTLALPVVSPGAYLLKIEMEKGDFSVQRLLIQP
ncbi:MAG: T9SS type A sorting domain-containing protein [Bacteroidetes bacterium]|nr:T9SS type A sorting domain-containing protein [Bacteroidota bacterium]MDA0931493.1 T9SS type A sorting domain-containing protein [Bacteroidota bacterium]